MPSRQLYWTSLWPMILRHAVFDGTFFGVNDYLLSLDSVLDTPLSGGLRFATAAASASFSNLIFDIWKTRQMKLYPIRLGLREIVASLSISGYARNYTVKGVDLTVNWFVVGCLKDAFEHSL
jgi:hypothetical protein